MNKQMKRLILSFHPNPTLENESYMKYCDILKIVYAQVNEIDYKMIKCEKEIEGRHYAWSQIPLICKFVDTYDEILYLDHDVLITNQTINIFEYLKNLEPLHERSKKTPLVYTTKDAHNNTTASVALFDCRDKERVKSFLNDWWNDAIPSIYESPSIASVWQAWPSEKRSRICVGNVSVSQEADETPFFQVSENYKLARTFLAKKYYSKLLNRSTNMKRIGLVMRGQNFYSNGIGQNCIFIKHVLESAGYTVDLVNHEATPVVTSDLPYEFKNFDTLDLTQYNLFLFGSQVSPQAAVDKLRAHGIKCAMFNPTNVIDAFHQENFLYLEKKSETPLFEMNFHKTSDEIWITDAHSETNLEYLEVINRMKTTVKTIPSLWSPLFLYKNNVIPTYVQRKAGAKVDLVILEPNLGYCKSGWLPLVICEKFYLTHPDRVNKVYFFNTPSSNPTAMGMMNSLKLAEDNKIKFLNRVPINDILSFFSNPDKNDGNHVVFVSHAINCPLNYAYYDTLYTGFPFVHNSLYLKNSNIGYYYSGIFEGSRHIEKCLDSYNVSENLALSRKYLNKLDPYNESVTEEYKALVSNILGVPHAMPINPAPAEPVAPAFQFVAISKCEKRCKELKEQCDVLCKEIPLRFVDTENPSTYFPPSSIHDRKVMDCARNHFKALEFASRAESPEFSVILEDDVSFHKKDFLKGVHEIVSDWDRIMGSDKMASIGWVPCRTYDSYLPDKPAATLTTLKGYKVLNNNYFIGATAYIVRKKDLAPFLPILIKDSYDAYVESVRKEFGHCFETGCEVIASDVVIPRILGQRAIFPPLAIERITPSLIGHTNNIYFDKFFADHEHLKSEYFTAPPPVPTSNVSLVVHESDESYQSEDSDLNDTTKPLVISYDNEPSNEGAQYFINTLKNNGWSYKIIGVGEQWEGWRTRILGYANILKRAHPKKLIVLSDARDVFCIRPSKAFTAGFNTFKKPVVTSMEIFCNGYDEFRGDIDYTKGNCMTLASYWNHHKMDPPMRKFVNNGLVAGYAADLYHVYQWMYDNGYTDDQFGLGNYVINFPENVAVDADAKLLHTSNFGVNAGIQYIHKQADDAPTLAELNGNRAFFLHISGVKNKGQNVIYKQVKMILDSGLVKPGLIQSSYGWGLPEYDEKW